MANEKTVLITGASRGIGAQTARVFAENGYNVVINYNNSKESANNLCAEITKEGFECIAIKADVSDYVQVDEMVKQVVRKYGFIDILVNNAAIAEQKLFCDITQQDWDDMFNINVKGMFNTTKCVIPQMINQKRGKIINISSIWGITGASCEVHYSASKSAIIGFTKALAKEMGLSGICVNCVAPGVIATQMNKNLDEETIKALKEDTPLNRIGEPVDIANTILFLASSKADFITGQVISPNGGFLI